jgi:3',5'-cyclic AMP phosphodiesterase CpdA
MTRLVFTSDLHINGPRYGEVSMRLFLERVLDVNPDILVLGGDIADGRNALRRGLALIRDIIPHIPILVVPGNHDLWNTAWPEGLNSDDIFYTKFSEVCKEFDCVNLEEENFIVDNWLLTGSVIWYDFSAKRECSDASISMLPDEYYEKNAPNRIVDARRMNLTKGPKEFSKERLDRLCERIDSGLQGSNVEHLAVFSHVPMFKETITWSSHSWNLGSPYFYNLTAGDRLLNYDQLKLVASGHTHFGRKDDSRGFPCLVCYADYGTPKGFEIEIEADGTATYKDISIF